MLDVEVGGDLAAASVDLIHLDHTGAVGGEVEFLSLVRGAGGAVIRSTCSGCRVVNDFRMFFKTTNTCADHTTCDKHRQAQRGTGTWYFYLFQVWTCPFDGLSFRELFSYILFGLGQTGYAVLHLLVELLLVLITGRCCTAGRDDSGPYASREKRVD